MRQALDDLGITEADAAEIGIRVYKVAMPWPLEPEGVRQFAEGLEEILVVEEKRQIVEYQLKEQLYNWRDDVRPRVVGKFDEKGEWVRPHGDWLLPAAGELTPAMIARVIAKRIERLELHPRTHASASATRVDFINAKEEALAKPKIDARAPAVLLLGLPAQHVDQRARRQPRDRRHRLPRHGDLDGPQARRRSRTWAAKACRGSARRRSPTRSTSSRTSATAPTTTAASLAIRAAVAAKVNITYKILYNDAVAMTGGQPVDGPLSPQDIARQVAAEGVTRSSWSPTSRRSIRRAISSRAIDPIHHRDELDARAARAARDRRARRSCSTTRPAPPRSAAAASAASSPIPPSAWSSTSWCAKAAATAACKSNCVSVAPVETEFGRKRTIDQSSCNKDYSCVKGFCPSFVTVEGGTAAQAAEGGGGRLLAACPTPALADDADPYGILVTGIGGTGVVTIGALLGMAAHLEGKGCSVLDMTGLAQKNGAVVSHVRIADTPEQLYATRIAAGEAKLVLACDILTGVGHEALAKMQKGVTQGAGQHGARDARAVHARTRTCSFPTGSMEQEIKDAVAPGDAEFLDATKLATGLMGDSIATNLFMVGYAYQRGLIPVGEAAILKAIELNGAAVESNKQSFHWGRLAAVDPAQRRRRGAAARRQAGIAAPVDVARRDDRRAASKFLTDYQDAAYAKRYATSSRTCATIEGARHARHRPSSPKPSRATTSSCSRSRTSTKSRGCTPSGLRRSAWRRSSKATTSSSSISRRRSLNKPDADDRRRRRSRRTARG